MKGPFYKGVCYSEERWEYWEKCLADIHENGEGKVNEKTTKLAGMTKERMEDIRKNYVDESDDEEDDSEEEEESKEGEKEENRGGRRTCIGRLCRNLPIHVEFEY